MVIKPIRLLCYMFLFAFFGRDRAQRTIAFLYRFELTDQQKHGINFGFRNQSPLLTGVP